MTSSHDTTKLWWVCDKIYDNKNKEFCLVKEEGKGGGRCVRHGSILTPEHALSGMTRKEARKYLSNEDKHAR